MGACVAIRLAVGRLACDNASPGERKWRASSSSWPWPFWSFSPWCGTSDGPTPCCSSGLRKADIALFARSIAACAAGAGRDRAASTSPEGHRPGRWLAQDAKGSPAAAPPEGLRRWCRHQRPRRPRSWSRRGWPGPPLSRRPGPKAKPRGASFFGSSQRPLGQPVHELLHVRVGAGPRLVRRAVEDQLSANHHADAVRDRQQAVEIA